MPWMLCLPVFAAGWTRNLTALTWFCLESNAVLPPYYFPPSLPTYAYGPHSSIIACVGRSLTGFCRTHARQEEAAETLVHEATSIVVATTLNPNT
jgi:hypothetical protein